MMALHLLRLHPDRWRALLTTDPKESLLLVVGAWLLASWNRLGFLLFSAPREMARTVTTGIWAAFALTLAITVLAALTRSDDEHLPDRWSLVRVVAYAHLPLLAIGFVVMFTGSLLTLLGPGWIAVVLGLGLWTPAMLLVGTATALDRTIIATAPVVVLPYLAWLTLVAWPAVRRLDHLL